MNSTQPQRKADKIVHRDGFVGLSKDYLDHGDPTFPCESCRALLWNAETFRRATDALDQSYSICCSRGKVKLGNELLEPPKLTKDLITKEHNKSASFIDNIRRYNSMFTFTSMGGKVDDTVNYGLGLFCYRIHGENYHRVGSLLPGTGKTPKFAQLYIFDTDNEISNRIKAVSKESCTSSKDKKLDHELATKIRDMLDSINPLVKKFRMAGFIAERNLKSEDRPDVMTRVFKMKLDSLMKDLNERHIFGRVKGAVYTIEFQKRGLPHCHILLWLDPEDKITTTAKIDKYISHEIPNKNEDPKLYQIVTDHMMHGPCGADNPSCPCTYVAAGICMGKTWHVMAADVENVERIKQNKPDLQLSDIQKKNICLTYIEHMLLCNNKSLKNILNMPYPNNEYTMEGYNRLIYDETSYKKDELRKQHQTMYGSFTSEQKGIYSTVMDVVDKNTGGMFFVYGYGGTGKTYLYKTMSAALRSQGDIVLNGASRGITALLLEGGRTAHSRFAIPINILEESMCHIPADSDLAHLIRQANLIERAILAPTHEMVDMINECMMGLIPGEETLYESSYSVSLADDDTNFDESIYTTDFLSGITMSGLPKHAIKLKIGTPVMLMKNIDQKAGLCNGTRLQLLRMGIKVIEAKIISDENCHTPKRGLDGIRVRGRDVITIRSQSNKERPLIMDV
ncbi:ATP-dependent DNA helicase RRM3-like protein [Tanacetum coccineum]